MSQFKTILEPAAMRFSQPLAFPNAARCEQLINIGLFFDGTDNNHNVHPSGFNTNISKLSSAYRLEPEEGYFRYYVSGVGTPFSELGKKKSEAMGGPAGAGGEARIIYGLLQVINAVHQSVNDQLVRFELPTLAALCSTARVAGEPPEGANPPPARTAEQKILEALGLPCGLVDAQDRHFLGQVIEGERRKFFSRVSSELRQKVMDRRTLPVPVAIYLDVFGFSRGAAQARVFVSWLYRYLMVGGTLFGVPAQVRMLGLFDTVASVGLTNAIGSAGHNAWATAQDLCIHPEVRNCLHQVALHELRTNFPSDSVAQGEELPPNCQEHHCPGVHSDVGGGYGPGEQGKGVRLRRVVDGDGMMEPVPDADLRLSNLPLLHMYDAARSACRGHVLLPWIDIHVQDEKEPERLTAIFGLGGQERVRKTVAEYFQNCDVPAGLNTREALREHGLRYLAWRYQVTRAKHFEELKSVEYASSLDRAGIADYRRGELLFRQQVDLLERPPSSFGFDLLDNRATYQGFHPKAQEIYKKMKTTRLRPGIGQFFDGWVHDSYAGFIGKFKAADSNWVKTTGGHLGHLVAEAQRYVRWRQLYQGSNEGLNSRLPGNDDDTRMVA